MNDPLTIREALALSTAVDAFVGDAGVGLLGVRNSTKQLNRGDRDEIAKFQRYALRRARSKLRLAAARIDRALRRHGDTSL